MSEKFADFFQVLKLLRPETIDGSDGVDVNSFLVKEKC